MPYPKWCFLLKKAYETRIIVYKEKAKLELARGGVAMKKIGLGIAILLFAIILFLCSSGMEPLVLGIGVAGLIFSIIGFMEHK